MTTTAATAVPPEFRRAVAGLQRARVRSEVELGSLPLAYHKAIEDSVVVEVSTPQLDDVVRLQDRYGRSAP